MNASRPFAGLKVLIVLDRSWPAAPIRDWFVSQGAQVTIAATAGVVISYCRRNEFDLAFISLPSTQAERQLANRMLELNMPLVYRADISFSSGLKRRPKRLVPAIRKRKPDADADCAHFLYHWGADLTRVPARRQ